MLPKLIVKKSKISGTGLFADEPIKKCSVVMIWNTDAYLISESEYNRRQSLGDQIMVTTGVRYVREHFLFTDEKPRRENYINHSFTPNILYHCGICFALKDIKKDEELTVNYTYLLSETDTESFVDKITGKLISGVSGMQCLKETTRQLSEILES
jgi:SET domain-containing protein